MRTEDVEGGVEVLIRAFNEFDVRRGAEPAFQTFSQARATLQLSMRIEPDGTWAAVDERDKVVGIAVGYRRGEHVSIGPVAVHPMVQGRGIGRKLLRAILDANPDASCFVLSHAGSNAAAFNLYRTEGFRVVQADAGFAGVPGVTPPPPDDVRRARRSEVVRTCEIDAEMACVDRSRELEMLVGMGELLLHPDGYLVRVRVGPAAAIGPGATRTPEAMTSLLAAGMQDLPSAGLLMRAPANGWAVDVLAGWRLLPRGVGNTMVRGRWPERRGEHIYPAFPEIL